MANWLYILVVNNNTQSFYKFDSLLRRSAIQLSTKEEFVLAKISDSCIFSEKYGRYEGKKNGGTIILLPGDGCLKLYGESQCFQDDINCEYIIDSFGLSVWLTFDYNSVIQK